METTSQTKRTPSWWALIRSYQMCNLMYIRYDATIETKLNGQKKIKGKYPKFTQIEEQPRFGGNRETTIPY